MTLKRCIIAGIIFFTPYTAGNLFVFIFLIPLLSIIYTEGKHPIGRLIAIIALVTAVVLLPLLTYDVGVYVFSVFLMTLFLGLFLFISNFLIERCPGNLMSIFIPVVVWVMLIYAMDVRSLISSAFDVGILFPQSAPIIWYTGSMGLTALLLLFNSSAARFLIKRDRTSLFVAALLVIVFISAYVFSINGRLAIDEDGSQKVALVQGDVVGRTLFGHSEDIDDRISRYVDLSRQAEKEEVDIVLWPEFSLPIDIMNKFPKKMKPIIAQMRSSDTQYVIGSMLTDPKDRNVSYNTALIFSGDGDLSDVYYSEEPAIFNKGITARSNGGKLFLDKTGILLCWEEINGEISRDYVQGGAEHLISLSSNAALDYSWFKNYISYFSRARAAENMRYFARVTQSGVTQVIDPFGRVQVRLPSGRAAFLVATIYGYEGRTFYSKHGDILVRSFVLLAAVILIVGLVVSVLGCGSDDGKSLVHRLSRGSS